MAGSSSRHLAIAWSLLAAVAVATEAATPPPASPSPPASPVPADARDPRSPKAAAPLELVDPRRPLDEGVADRAGLARSLRRTDPGLAATGFDRIFEAPDGSGRLIRRQGGLTAVFSRSVYGGDGGSVAEIPPGTVYRLGGEGPLATGSEAALAGTRRGRPDAGTVHPGLDWRVPGARAGFGTTVPSPPSRPADAASIAPPPPSPAAGEVPTPLPRFMTDEAYRRQRLERLLERLEASR